MHCIAASKSMQRLISMHTYYKTYLPAEQMH